MNPIITSYLVSIIAGCTNNFLSSILKDRTVEEQVKKAYDNAMNEFYQNSTIRRRNFHRFNDSFEKLSNSISSKEALELTPEENTFLDIFYKKLMEKETAWRYIQSEFFLNQSSDLDLIKGEVNLSQEKLSMIQHQLNEFLKTLQEVKNPIHQKQVEFIQNGRIRNYKTESKGRLKEKDKIEQFFLTGNDNFLFLFGSGGMGKTHLLYDVIQRLPEEPVYFLAHKNSTLEELFELCFDSEKVTSNSNQLCRNFIKQIEKNQLTLVIDDFYEISDVFLRKAILSLSNIRSGKIIVISRSLPLEFDQSDADINKIRLNVLDKAAFQDYCKEYYAKNDFSMYFSLTSELLDELYKVLMGYPLGVKFVFDLYKNVGAKKSVTENLELFDEDKDASNKKYMDRLLDSVISHGDPLEMELLKEISVFTTPVDLRVLQRLPSFHNQYIYHSLVRKDFIWISDNNQIELHALVRELLFQKNEHKAVLNEIAANYYEEKSTKSALEDVDSFRLAAFHFANTDEELYKAFLLRQEKIFGKSSQIKDLVNDNLFSSIERLKYRIELYPETLDAYTELTLIYLSQNDLDNARKIINKGLKVDASNEYLLLNKARLFEAERKLDQAIETYDEILELNPCNLSALLLQGKLYRTKKRYRDAHRNLLATYYNDEANIQSQNELGILYREWKKYDAAENRLKPLAEKGYKVSINELGILYREWGKPKEAENWLKSIAGQHGHVHSINELGILYREQKRYKEAEEWLKPLAEKGDNIHSINELGILYRDWGKYKKAEKWLKPLAEKGENAHSINELGILYRDWGKYKKAEKWLTKLAKKGSKQAINELGILYREWKKYKKAEKWLKPLAEKGNKLAINELGILYHKGRKFREAEKWLKPLAQTSNDVHAINELGILYRDWGRYEEAEKWLKPIAEKGDNVHSINELGILYRDWKKYEEAEKWLKPLAEKNENVHSVNELGILYRDWKKYEEAEKWLKPLAKKKNFLACNELAILYREWGRSGPFYNRELLERSKEWYLKTIELKRDNIQSYDGLGRVLVMLKKYGEARDYLLKGLEINPYDWRIQKQLTDLLTHRIKNKKEAMKYYDQLKANRRFRDKFDYLEKTRRKIDQLRD